MTTDLEQPTRYSSAAKLRALSPAIQHRVVVLVGQAMASLPVRLPASAQTRLLAWASSKVDEELARLLEQDPLELDQLLGTIAGICAGLRSDDRPIDASELPAPFGRPQLVEAHRWIVGD